MAVRILLATLLLGALLLRYGVGFEHNFLFFPVRELAATPSTHGWAYEDVWFGQEGQLHGWFLPGEGPVTLLWLHGNGGNVSHRLDWLRVLRTRLRAHVFLFDYRGYGQSGGNPSEAGTYQDARDALAYLRTRPDVDPNLIVYYGESLGGAVAAQLATEDPPHRLVLQSTFTSVLDMARVHYPFLLPLSPLVKSRYATIEKVGLVRAPLLVVHGEEDEIVPVAQARQLFEAAEEPKQLLIVPRAHHNDLIDVGGVQYAETLRSFVAPPPP